MSNPADRESRFGRRDSLVRQASIDRVRNEGLKRRNTILHRHELEKSSHLAKQLIASLSGDAINLFRDAPGDDYALHVFVVITQASDSRPTLTIATQKFLACGVLIDHLESRKDREHAGEIELLFECRASKRALVDALTKLVIEKPVDRIDLKEAKTSAAGDAVSTSALISGAEDVWFPRHVSELDQCAHVSVKYEPSEDPKHPGFGDYAYIARRAELNEIANSYRYGDPLPFVNYTEEENRTWCTAYRQLKQIRAACTCAEYQKNVRRMEEDGVITDEKIPQLRDLSLYIQRRTGFELRPCGGLLSARDFLSSLAYRVFQATLYVRHSSAPHHCPEPDVIHEVLGHCPMFADPNLAQMSQEIGLLSLGASDAEIERLSTLYWFVIEFGLCEQDGSLKAIGAGLISAYGELKYACSDEPQHEVFDPETTALRTYEDSDYQPVYFVAVSISDAMEKVRSYAYQHMRKGKWNDYDSLTRTVDRVPFAEFLNRRARRAVEGISELSRLFDDFLLKDNTIGDDKSEDRRMGAEQQRPQ